MPTHLRHQELVLKVSAVAVGWLTCWGSAHLESACGSCVCCPAALHCCYGLLLRGRLRAAGFWPRPGRLSGRLASLLVGALCRSCSPLRQVNSSTTHLLFTNCYAKG
jgi:hypothetical protein